MGYTEDRRAVLQEMLKRGREKTELQNGFGTFALVLNKDDELQPMAGAHKADDFDTNILVQMLVTLKSDFRACGILTPKDDKWEALLESEDGVAEKITMAWKLKDGKVELGKWIEAPADAKVFTPSP